MKRRGFIKASLFSGTLVGALPIVGLANNAVEVEKKSGPEFYELRVYSLKNKAQQQLVEDFWKEAAIPALNRIGSRKIGVFTEQKPEGQTKLFVVIPFSSIENYITSTARLLSDVNYQQAGAAYLNVTAAEPAYERVQSSLLQAFAGLPQMVVPENKPRLFELRRYESHSESAGKKKVEMFNKGGEISIFKRVGLTPVFFGETIFGEMRPNLTYMITFDDMDEHDRNWKVFGSDPEWKKISALPEYKDAKIVSRITRTFLLPTSFSQV
ncbi:MAG: NIPSNAP family protein [Chitinophagaceae bacterium]